MIPHVRTLTGRLLLLLLLVQAFCFVPSADAYSVLSHEEVVDLAWQTTIVPMLRTRFPGISPDEIREAHAYAYGGSVIQDIGYYPFGSHYFSDLLHYVRPEEFVDALIRDSTTPNEYAFALGSLAHYCGDIIGHPAVNLVVAQENPALERVYGKTITYAEDPTAHIRTEFGFDVVEVAQGHYLQENYRDFIGFQVAKPLLERAFFETYGVPMNSIITHEDLAISTYRKAVSTLIPKMTKIAFVSYKKQIQQAAPGMDKRKFLYRLNKTEYKQAFGTDYTHVSFGGEVAAFFLRLLPKIGPLKALKVNIPDAKEQDVYLKSMNSTVDRYRLYLAEIHAAPAPLPLPDAQAAEDARKAADKIEKGARLAQKKADKAEDPADKAAKEQIAANAQKLADHAEASAARTEQMVQTIASGETPDAPRNAVPPGSPIQPPSTPRLPHLDLDTGKPSSAGEYRLADETYAHLLGDLVKSHATPAPGLTSAQAATVTAHPLNPALVAAIETFFAHPVARTGPPPTSKQGEREAALAAKVQSNLARLRTIDATAPAGAPAPIAAH